MLVREHADYLPPYRPSQILARSGVGLHRTVLPGWVGTAAFHFRPVDDRPAEHLRLSRNLVVDEIAARVPDAGACDDQDLIALGAGSRRLSLGW